MLSGLGAGAIGMGGPPVSLWVLAHDWPAIKQRAFLWLTFLLLIPPLILLLIFRFGSPLVSAMAMATLLVPVSILGAWAGVHLGHTLNRERLRVAMMAMLVLISVRLIWS